MQIWGHNLGGADSVWREQECVCRDVLVSSPAPGLAMDKLCSRSRVTRRAFFVAAAISTLAGSGGAAATPSTIGSAMESRPDSPAAPVCKAVKSTTDMAHNISDWPKGFDSSKMQLTDIQVLACLSVRPQSTPDPRATPLSSQGVE